jgi:hypothetical protein
MISVSSYFTWICQNTDRVPAILHRRSDGPIKQLSECIGNSEKLFSAFADYCALKVREESAPSWGGLVRNVLTSNQEAVDKVPILCVLECAQLCEISLVSKVSNRADLSI